MNRYLSYAILSTAVLSLEAQVADQIRRATISGSRGASGKCTIEVRVDHTAEVDILGDSGRLRTLAGQPSTWTRMQCTDPLPSSMSDFRFRGIDGRGSQQLVRDPRNNNGIAVIRIEDPRGGAEGYTFDIEWSGASGTPVTGGFETGGSDPFGRRRSPTRAGSRGMSTERAVDLCRDEVRTRAERDHGLRNIDITSAGLDTNQARRDWIVGTFSEGSRSRRGGGYRFNCAFDFASGQVRNVEILRADGGLLQPSGSSGGSGILDPSPAGSGQSQAYRACQDAVVARTSRDGYQNVNFRSTAVDSRRSDWIVGTLTASRGPVTDTFDFGCSMDMGSARVRNVEVNRR